MAERIVLYTGVDSREVAEALRRGESKSVDLRAWNRLECAQPAKFVFELTVPKDRADLVTEQPESGVREYRVSGYETAWLWKAPPDDPLAPGPR